MKNLLSYLISGLVVILIPIGASSKDINSKVYPELDVKGKQKVVVIAHRGFSGKAPENTLISFQKAIDIGADMLELDILFSADKKIMVIHDETLDRTTDGKGKVNDYTFDQLKELDAGSWFSEKFAGEKIPTLTEVLELTKGKIMVNIEIKSEAVNPFSEKNGIEIKALELVKKYNMEKQVVFSSFNPLAVKRIKQFDKSISTAFLYHDKITKSVDQYVNPLMSDAFNPNKKYLSERVINEAKQAKVRVNTYTVNSRRELVKYIELGVDGIFTDFPDRLISILSEK